MILKSMLTLLSCVVSFHPDKQMIHAASQPDALLSQMGSLADETRLRLLRILERHELGVGDLCSVLQLPQSTVSRHLKLLSDEQWLRSRRQGTTNLYHMVFEELSDSQTQLWQLVRQQTELWATVRQDQVRLASQLRKRQQDSHEFFAGAAAQWDRTRQEMYGETFTRHALLSLLPRDWVVADLGCGTGSITAELARHVQKVIAVDVSQAMLETAREQTASLNNVELRQGEIESLPIEDGSCDAALLVLVLSYLPDPAAALQQMRRILRPGGRGVVIDLMRHDRDDFRRRMKQQCLGFETDELTAMLSDAGFTDPTCYPLSPEPQAKGPALLLASAQTPPEVPPPKPLKPQA